MRKGRYRIEKIELIKNGIDIGYETIINVREDCDFPSFSSNVHENGSMDGKELHLLRICFRVGELSIPIWIHPNR